SPQLDEHVRKLHSLIRREAGTEELEKLTLTLTEAIGALDRPGGMASLAMASGPMLAHRPGTQPQEPAREVEDPRMRSILAALVGELRRDTELTEQADALDSKLAAPLNNAQLTDVLASLTEL